MNNFPSTLSSLSALPASKPAPFDLRIVLLMLVVGVIDLCSGHKLFRLR